MRKQQGGRAAVAIVAVAVAACGRDAVPPPADVRTTSAPAPALAVESGAPGTLTREAVHRRVVDEIASLPPRCAGVESKIDPYEATLHLEIGASGEVEVARARGNHPLLDACVSDVARTWRFEPSEGRTVADVPIAIVKPGP